MATSFLIVIIGWLVALAIFFAFIVLLRYLQYRERIAMISYGLRPRRLPRQQHKNGLLRAGLITAMVGFSLTIGLYPLGFILPKTFASIPFHLGPWLLPGLIPLAVGTALITSYYLERDNASTYQEQDLPRPAVKDALDTRDTRENEHNTLTEEQHDQ
jgi:formate hydrogenlyase subunit 3/multisubunit Na+/H+ antiporter MnhD subunit